MAEEKKDLTSLVDLAKREPPSHGEEGGPIAMAMPDLEKVSEEDFGNLEDLSKQAMALEQSAANGEASVVGASPDFAMPSESEGLVVPAPEREPGSDSEFEFESNPESNPVLVSASEPTPPSMTPAITPSSTSGADLQTAPPSHGFMNFESPPTENASSEFQMPSLDGDASIPAPEPVELPEAAALPEASLQSESLAAPPPQLTTKSHQSTVAPVGKQDFEAVKQFGEKFAIGHPRIEASPPFSVMATLQFSEKKAQEIGDILSAEDYGIGMKDVAVQLKSGKLFIPKVSEFAAVTLAQKLREIVDTIEIGLSDEIYRSKNRMESDSDFENVLFDAETFHPRLEEVRDLGAEPESERDLFTSHLNSIDGFHLTRVLSAVSASKVVAAEVVEDTNKNRLEIESDALMKDLVSKAFKMGAHGIVGVSFSLKATDVAMSHGKKKVYRLWAMGTAVRMQADKTPGNGTGA